MQQVTNTTYPTAGRNPKNFHLDAAGVPLLLALISSASFTDITSSYTIDCQQL